jgi:hypothetical protein
MNKITLALVVGAGLVLGLTGPRAQASTIQTIDTPTLSASTFNSLFTPYNNAILSPFQFDGTSSSSGLIQSQVFQGTGAAAGLYAYAYQVAVNPQTDSSGVPVHVDSTSFMFNSTPLGTNFASGGQTAYGYVIPNGQVGGLTSPARRPRRRCRGRRRARPGSSGPSMSTRPRSPRRWPPGPTARPSC